jgi:hypothetical protein
MFPAPPIPNDTIRSGCRLVTMLIGDSRRWRALGSKRFASLSREARRKDKSMLMHEENIEFSHVTIHRSSFQNSERSLQIITFCRMQQKARETTKGLSVAYPFEQQRETLAFAGSVIIAGDRRRTN